MSKPNSQHLTFCKCSLIRSRSGQCLKLELMVWTHLTVYYQATFKLRRPYSKSVQFSSSKLQAVVRITIWSPRFLTFSFSYQTSKLQSTKFSLATCWQHLLPPHQATYQNASQESLVSAPSICYTRFAWVSLPITQSYCQTSLPSTKRSREPSK